MFQEIGLKAPSNKNYRMRVLITGHRGDTGSVVHNLLTSNGHTCFFHETINSTDYIDRTIHAASRPPISDPNDIINSNIIYLQDIVKESIMKKSVDFIFLSSVSVYDENISGAIDENFLSCPNSLYSMTKIFGEKYLETMGILGASLRLPGILETQKCSNFMGKLINKLESNMPVNISNGDSLFNAYIDPTEIARFSEEVPKIQKWGVVNFAVQPKWTLKETVFALREMIQSNSTINEVPAIHKMRQYTIDKLINDFDFIPSPPEDMLEAWIRRRKTELKIQS